MSNCYAFLLLAAGKSSRMSEIDKGTLIINNKPLIQHHIENIKCIEQIKQIIIVCSRKNINTYRNIVNNKNIHFVINENPERGMFSSVIEGVKHYNLNLFQGLFIGNVDCSVRHQTIEKIIYHINTFSKSTASKQATHLTNKKITIIPEWNSKKGHPKFLNKQSILDLLHTTNLDEINNIRLDYWLEDNTIIIKLPINDERIVMNINTEKDYKYWINYLRKNN